MPHGEDVVAALPELLREIRLGLEAASPAELLDALLGAGTPCRALLDGGTRLDHVGFLLPRGSEGAFRNAASAAGFGHATPPFASLHLARELGLLAGLPEVPTTVAKQTGALPGHGPVALEAFFPDVDAPVSRGWIARGVGSHVALEVRGRRQFETIVARFPVHGLCMPSFMEGPRSVPAEQATIAYFELGPRAAAPRLEVRLRDGPPR